MNTIDKFIEHPFLSNLFVNFNINIANKITHLSVEEKFLIWHYTGLGYENLNNQLRKHTQDGFYLNFEKHLNDSLDKLPSFGGFSYRGEMMSKSELVLYQSALDNGNDLTMLCFYSCSSENSIAQDFANNRASRKADHNVIFNIIGFSGKNVESLSQHPEEREILFKSKTRFLVEDIRMPKYKKSYTYIDLREI